MLIGIPGSGKSTSVKQLQEEFPSFKVASSDEYIDKIAKQKGKTYDEVHFEAIDDATKFLKYQVNSFLKNKENFIWDQTNIVKSSRIKKLKNLISNNYSVIAIVIELSPEELQTRLNKRTQEGGKTLSAKIIQCMIESYEKPTYDEGFDSILLIGDNGAAMEIPKEKYKAKF